MPHIDGQSDSRLGEVGQPYADNLDQSKLSADETVRLGQQAWNDVCFDHTWQDWLRVGAALCIGRTEAMHEAGMNRPKGRSYNIAFGAWLKYGFHSIDPGDRARLFDVMDHRAEIESWRKKKLSPAERLKFNHPTTVWRKWKTATIVPNLNTPPSPIAKLNESIRLLSEENHRLQRELSVGGGDLWTPDDAAEDIATVMVGKLSPNKAESVARAILKKLKNKKVTPLVGTQTNRC